MILIDAVKHRYGRLIPSTRLACEIDRITDGEVSLTSEAVRKWLRGVSIPNGRALVALDCLLGDYFVEKRKLKKSTNQLINSLEQMNIKQLEELQGLINFRIENSVLNDKLRASASNLQGKQE